LVDEPVNKKLLSHVQNSAAAAIEELAESAVA
jgi:hypothetical protein